MWIFLSFLDLRNLPHSSHFTWWFLSGLTRPILVSSFSSNGSGSRDWMIFGAGSAYGPVTPETDGVGSSGVACGCCCWGGPSGWSCSLCSIRMLSDTKPAKHISHEKYLWIFMCPSSSCTVSNAASQYEHFLLSLLSAWPCALLMCGSSATVSLKVLEQSGHWFKWVGQWIDKLWGSLNCLPHWWHLYSLVGCSACGWCTYWKH